MTNADRIASLLSLAAMADAREELALLHARQVTGKQRTVWANMAAQAARDAASLRREAAALA